MVAFLPLPSKKIHMHEILKRYRVGINFLDSGCVIEVGCRSFAFSVAATGIWELQQYSNDPEAMIRKWLSKKDAESIINPNICCEPDPNRSYPLPVSSVDPEPIIHNPQVTERLITDLDSLIHPAGANATHWTYKKLILLVADTAVCHENTVKPESRLSEDLGLDSLDAVELIMKVENEFQISIPDSQAEEVRTVSDLHNIVLSQILNKPENERATPIPDQQ